MRARLGAARARLQQTESPAPALEKPQQTVQLSSVLVHFFEKSFFEAVPLLRKGNQMSPFVIEYLIQSTNIH
jgi:hypothetical protein